MNLVWISSYCTEAAEATEVTLEEQVHQTQPQLLEGIYVSFDKAKDKDELHLKTSYLKEHLDVEKLDAADDHVSTSSSEVAQLEDVCLSQGVQESHDDDWELIGVDDIPTMPEEPSTDEKQQE